MESSDRDVLVQSLIREGISLAVMLGVVWALGHATDIRHWWWARQQARQQAQEAAARAYREALAETRADISRMEHS